MKMLFSRTSHNSCCPGTNQAAHKEQPESQYGSTMRIQYLFKTLTMILGFAPLGLDRAETSLSDSYELFP